MLFGLYCQQPKEVDDINHGGGVRIEHRRPRGRKFLRNNLPQARVAGGREPVPHDVQHVRLSQVRCVASYNRPRSLDLLATRTQCL